MVKIHILYTKAGGGHITTARVLGQYLNALLLDNEIKLIDAYDIDNAKKSFLYSYGVIFYNELCKTKGFYRWIQYPYHLLSTFLVKIFPHAIFKNAYNVIQLEQPDIVISVMPFINIYMAKKLDSTKINFITIMTEFSEAWPGMWFAPQTKQTFFFPKSILTEQYNNISNALPISSIISGESLSLNIEYKKPDIGIFVITVIYGSQGSSAMLEIAKSLNKVRVKIEVYFICGHDQKTFGKIMNLKTSYTKTLYGFTYDVAKLFKLSDVVIMKPGALTIVEALEAQTIPLVESNMFSLVQEYQNVNWLLKNKYGLSFRSPKHLVCLLNNLLPDEELLRQYQSNIGLYNNNALIKIGNYIKSWMNKESI
jgi:UDP-N-acetylglucosamine:LPS N-acetylglucosamine transferase